MFKKVKSLLMILVLMLAVIPATFADIGYTGNDVNVSVGEDGSVDVDIDNTSISTDGNGSVDVSTEDVNVSVDEDGDVEVEISEEESIIINSGVGAQVRLLQLQKRIEAQVEAGEIIINRINEVKPDFDTTSLEEIVDEFNALIALIEEADLEQAADVLASEYVAMKKEAINLTQEFKKTAKDALSESEKQALRKKAEEKKQEWKERKDDRIEKLKNQYNLNKLEDLANKVGYDVEDAKAKIQAGELTIAQVREEVANAFNDLDEEKKTEIKSELKETRVKQNINLKEKREELVEKAKAKREEIVTKARERKTELVEKAKARREELKANAEARKEKLKANAETRREELKAQAEVRREELKAQAEVRKEELKADNGDDSVDDDSTDENLGTNSSDNS